ncbi:MAG: hypothetical protein M3Q89_07160 [Verrucomicrobiota bacterium]|nr:hypothetical protein [Verrucomicrobiota bacterium]
MAVIIVLAGLILSTSGYVQKKGNRSRAEAEIAAMSAALESYKADNGIYPRGISISTPPTGMPNYSLAVNGTDDLDARTNGDPNDKQYQEASRYLYEQLSGDTDLDLAVNSGNKSYFAFKESQLALIKDASGKNVGLSHIRDPFGNSYGYSTANAAYSETSPLPATQRGNNPTFDLWSTGDRENTSLSQAAQWIKNW